MQHQCDGLTSFNSTCLIRQPSIAHKKSPIFISWPFIYDSFIYFHLYWMVQWCTRGQVIITNKSFQMAFAQIFHICIVQLMMPCGSINLLDNFQFLANSCVGGLLDVLTLMKIVQPPSPPPTALSTPCEKPSKYDNFFKGTRALNFLYNFVHETVN